MHYLDNNELRDIIEGTITYKPCNKCSGRGYNWVDWDGNEFTTKPARPISDNYHYCKETCNLCEGLRYIPNIK